MFDITRIELNNFKSYVGKHEFDFPTEPGLYFLTGSNELEPRLESNGSGKSTLLDAIYWCLYGKTPRGLRAGDIVSWGERGCGVSLFITVGKETYVIRRTQNPNSLTINGDSVDQSGLDRVLNVTPTAFMYSVLMPQFGQSFYELSPSDKLSLFSQIMNLENWLEYSHKAADEADTLEEQISSLSRQIGALELSLQTADSELQSLRDKSAGFEAEQKKVADRAHRNIMIFEAKASQLKEEIEKHEEELAAIDIAISANSDVVKKAYDAMENARQKTLSSTSNFAKSCALLEAAVKEYDRLAELTGTCPTCQQGIDDGHMTAHLKHKKKHINALRANWDKGSAEVDRVQKALTAATNAYNEATKNRDKFNTPRRQISNLIDDAKRNLAVVKNSLKAQLDAVPEDNPYAALLAEKESRIKRDKERQIKLGVDVAALTAKYDTANFWVAGFKKVRLFIIEETLRALEVEVNSSLNSLGLNDWSINFDVERENKSGGVTKGFTVLVRAPGQADAAKAEAWSGGESQRLQLACDLGLANLIMQQAGLVNTIEFYDEPSKHLSKAGLLDLAETLRSRAIDDNKRIFLVDHNIPEFGDFNDVITITKDEEGSHFD